MTRSYSWSLDRPSGGATHAGGRLMVNSSCGFSVGRGCSGQVRLVVPEGLPVTVSTSDGSVLLRDLTGSVTSSTSDGHVTLRNLSGPVDASTSDGALDVTGLTGQLTSGPRRVDPRERPAQLPGHRQSSDGGIGLGSPRRRTTPGPGQGRLVAWRAPRRDQLQGHHRRQRRPPGRSVPTDPGAERQIAVTASDGSITVDTITVDSNGSRAAGPRPRHRGSRRAAPRRSTGVR